MIRRRMFLYAISSGPDAPVKLGISSEPLRRLQDLQVASHQPLKIIGVREGTLPDEARLHRVLRASRLSGEWFRRTPELDSFLATLQPFDNVTRRRPKLSIPPVAQKRVKQAAPRQKQPRPFAPPPAGDSALRSAVRGLLILGHGTDQLIYPPKDRPSVARRAR